MIWVLSVVIARLRRVKVEMVTALSGVGNAKSKRIQERMPNRLSLTTLPSPRRMRLTCFLRLMTYRLGANIPILLRIHTVVRACPVCYTVNALSRGTSLISGSYYAVIRAAPWQQVNLGA